MRHSVSTCSFRRSVVARARQMYVGLRSICRYPAINTDASRKLDYTRGQLPELIDVIIEEKTRLFVSAVGVPPREVVERLHKAGILIMNVRTFSPLPSALPARLLLPLLPPLR